MTSFKWLTFNAFTPDELYSLLALRAQVFVVEQRCAYQDLDGRDQAAAHLLAFDQAQLVGCLRVIPDDPPSIGRVIVAPERRGQGLAHRLLQEALAFCDATYGPVPLTLNAQAHLQDLYARHGFKPSGPLFDEDGIPHVPMRRGSTTGQT